MTERIDAWLAAQALHDTFEGYGAEEIERMPLGQYQRLRERAGLVPVEIQVPSPEPAAAPQSPPEPAETTPQGIDPSQLSMEQYATLRGQLGIGQSRQEGVGLLNQSGSSWADAARRQPGRSSWQGANVVEPRRLEGRTERQGDMRDTRTLAQRFGIPGNSNTF